MQHDPDWYDAWTRLYPLHKRKSASYGRQGDRLRNFTAVAAVTGEVPERYVLLRMREKVERALNQIDLGQADRVREYLDLASLGLCAQALQARRDQSSGSRRDDSRMSDTQEWPPDAAHHMPCT